ncbi:MAG: potassium transporter TrkG [Chitinophagales bacterium]|nr:TrkH family potassium uptake protein [Bacteroidota bacterium]MCB9043859.1 TrkH family potassium uptake protein [Chitinophagales bacterium]
MNLNIRFLFNFIGVVQLLLAAAMLLCVPVSLIYGEHQVAWEMTACSMGLLLLGLFLWKALKAPNSNIRKREGYLIVSVGWLSMSIFGAIPYIVSGAIPSFADAVFETVSGFTTTGASILNDIEALPKGILFWRSLTQWLGGMGIIVLTVAILPILGIGGMELFVAESPGPTSDKLTPRIQETAKRLWAAYVLITGVECLLLWLAGMNFFDAINHSFTTMATGGFSTKQASAGFYSPLIQYILTFFMFVAGTNFALVYWGLKGKLNKFWKNEEFIWYTRITLIFTFIYTFVLYLRQGGESLEKIFRDSIFQVVSLITTTGFATADFLLWGNFLIMISLGLMFCGGSAGSTSGSVKIIRHIVTFKACLLEFKRLLHQRAVIPVLLNKKAIPSGIVANVLVFVLVYVMIYVVGLLSLSALGIDFATAAGSVATSLGNVGPGLGSTGPSANFFHLSDTAKYILSVLMLIGRLELFTILIIFTPAFWRSY